MSKRKDDSSNSSLGIVNILLREMSSLDRVYVIATTNQPWLIDEAFRRRLGSMVLVDLPTFADRIKIIRKYLRNTRNVIVKHEMESLASKTEGFSGADLELLTKRASTLALKRSDSSQYCISDGGRYYTCHQGVPGSELITERMRESQLYCISPIFYCDFIRALRKVKATADEDNLLKIREFARTYASY